MKQTLLTINFTQCQLKTTTSSGSISPALLSLPVTIQTLSHSSLTGKMYIHGHVHKSERRHFVQYFKRIFITIPLLKTMIFP